MTPRLFHACLPLSLLAAGCVVSLGGRDHVHHLTVDGVELTEKHLEHLNIAGWHAQGLSITCGMGDIRVEPTDGANRIEVVVHEFSEGDAWAVYEKGVLSSRSQSGKPSALGDVVVYTNDPLPRLALTTGMGDVTVLAIRVSGKVTVTSGMGDIEVHDLLEATELALETGMGDVDVLRAACTKLAAESGMGDVDVVGVRCKEANLEAGMGDVDVRSSGFGHLRARTGMGDVSLRESTWTSSDLDSGLGEIDVD